MCTHAWLTFVPGALVLTNLLAVSHTCLSYFNVYPPILHYLLTQLVFLFHILWDVLYFELELFVSLQCSVQTKILISSVMNFTFSVNNTLLSNILTVRRSAVGMPQSSG